MQITVFAKKRTTDEGKPFTGYLARLTRKSDGSTITASVRFREECGAPKADKCPMNIVFDKGAANMTTKEFVREDTGEVGTGYTLWVSEWAEGASYVDNSLDDFD